jgi:hypothetical protein
MDDRMSSEADPGRTEVDGGYGQDAAFDAGPDAGNIEADEAVREEARPAWAEGLPYVVRRAPAEPVSAAERMKARFSGDLSWRAGDEQPGDTAVSPYSVIDR